MVLDSACFGDAAGHCYPSPTSLEEQRVSKSRFDEHNVVLFSRCRQWSQHLPATWEFRCLNESVQPDLPLLPP